MIEVVTASCDIDLKVLVSGNIMENLGLKALPPNYAIMSKVSLKFHLNVH